MMTPPQYPPPSPQPPQKRQPAAIAIGVLILCGIGLVMAMRSTSLLNGTGTIWKDKGYRYQTLTGYVIDEFPNMVPMPDTYQAAVAVIIPASTYLCPRHRAAWENY